MVVKYRATRHTAGLYKDIREWVPGLYPNDKINGLSTNSGKFNQAKANQEDVRAKLLLGKTFDKK